MAKTKSCRARTYLILHNLIRQKFSARESDVQIIAYETVVLQAMCALHIGVRVTKSDAQVRSSVQLVYALREVETKVNIHMFDLVPIESWFGRVVRMGEGECGCDKDCLEYKSWSHHLVMLLLALSSRRREKGKEKMVALLVELEGYMHTVPAIFQSPRSPDTNNTRRSQEQDDDWWKARMMEEIRDVSGIGSRSYPSNIMIMRSKTSQTGRLYS